MNNIIVDLNSETQLVEAAQYGHLESFGALYERYHSPMVALAHFLSRIQGGRLFYCACFIENATFSLYVHYNM